MAILFPKQRYSTVPTLPRAIRPAGISEEPCDCDNVRRLGIRSKSPIVGIVGSYVVWTLPRHRSTHQALPPSFRPSMLPPIRESPLGGKISKQNPCATCDPDYMTGLIVKGSTALFLTGNDPGAQDAVALVNRVRAGNGRSCENKLAELQLERVARPKPLSGESIAWAYVFLALTEGDQQRLEPGPFDDELTSFVTAIEARQDEATRKDPV